MASSGFCILNIVAVAAAYARYKYGNLVQTMPSLYAPSNKPSNTTNINTATGTKYPKIAIVDIDIHHGNGTEEIVRNLAPREVFLPLPSSWAPVSRRKYKPWWNDSDQNDVFFSSIQLFDGDNFYPCSGDDLISSSSQSFHSSSSPRANNNTSSSPGANNNNIYGPNIVNIGLTNIPANFQKRTLSEKKKKEMIFAASREFREKISAMLLPRLDAFAPDLVFISAGFDGHYDDNYHFLTEEDYYWVTR